MQHTSHAFEQLARPVSHDESASNWFDPVATVAIAGDEFHVWCELPRLDPKLDSLPWLLLPDFPEQALDAGFALPLRRSASPWWAFGRLPMSVSDPSSLNDQDLERQLAQTLAVADWLHIPRFHVLAGSFNAAWALSLAARHPQRIASVVLRSPFIPFEPRIEAYLKALQAIDPSGFNRTFGPVATAGALYAALLNQDEHRALSAAQQWIELDHAMCCLSSLREPGGNGAVAGNRNPGSVSPGALRARQTFAHFLHHAFFMAPLQWTQDVMRIAQSGLPVGIVQGSADRICLPGGAHFLSEMLPNNRLLELPGVGHGPAAALMVSALAELIFGQRRPTAQLISLASKRVSPLP